ncbi:MAG: hypothetical protein MI892_17125, partial [Desulfobacterales bacterium]|nr:hypothetical protein [Desulfobacterales bacterium]
MIPASPGKGPDAGNVARDGFQGIFRHAEGGDAVEQGVGIGMGGFTENRLDVADLHQGTGVHDRHPVAEIGDDAQVMGNHDHPQVPLQDGLTEQLDNLGLDR